MTTGKIIHAVLAPTVEMHSIGASLGLLVYLHAFTSVWVKLIAVTAINLLLRWRLAGRDAFTGRCLGIAIRAIGIFPLGRRNEFALSTALIVDVTLLAVV